MRKYFLFDTETGGLDASSISLLSFSGTILNHNLDPINSINLLIRPDDNRYHVDFEALKVNKINLVDHHQKAIPESKAAKQLETFLLRAAGFSWEMGEKLIPAGHNIGRTDIPMGERLLGKDQWNRIFVHRTLDTGSIAQFLVLKGIIPETNSCSLQQLCEHFNITYVDAHTAEGDVLMTAEVLRAMVRTGSLTCNT